jgi:nucleotide-binding universal stress UspA family protein
MEMSKKYLVAIDGSEHGWKALDLAADLAIASDAQLLVVHVVPYQPIPDELRQFARAERVPVEEMGARFHYDRTIGDRLTGEAEARARRKGLDRVTTTVAEGDPASQIVALAESEGSDMVFLGSRGLGEVRGLLMGSVSNKVMHLAPCTCVAVK